MDFDTHRYMATLRRQITFLEQGRVNDIRAMHAAEDREAYNFAAEAANIAQAKINTLNFAIQEMQAMMQGF